MRNLTPDHLRRKVLKLDMHDLSAAEIAQETGVNRSTVDYIIRRTRGLRKEAWRGNVMLLLDPAGNLRPGARYSSDDMWSMMKYSDLANGTLFEITRRDRSKYRAVVRDGELVQMSA